MILYDFETKLTTKEGKRGLFDFCLSRIRPFSVSLKYFLLPSTGSVDKNGRELLESTVKLLTICCRSCRLLGGARKSDPD
ncbi:hypothetical protein NPIL_344131 [Nephila pilipes]|uniref:Uncharacterized protein n=1 Tax=Nephila pilipes TaxID=299642 RepID=A0A8X6PBJ7_NEPPI|nr:hypothetical protein NPIL_344131 [Nephila pilipes]